MSSTSTTVVQQPKVGLGPSEVSAFIVALGGLCTLFFGRDWGVARNAQVIGLVVSGLVVAASTIARAFKHHSLVQAETALRKLVMEMENAGDGERLPESFRS